MGDARMKGQLLLEAGRLADARREFWAEAEAAELVGDHLALAHAALGLGGVWVHEHRHVLERTRVLELQRRALSLIDAGSPLAHRLRIRVLAEEAYLTQDAELVLAELDATRACGDRVALAEALAVAHHCVLGPDHGRIRLALAEELLAVAASMDRSFDATRGLTWRTIDLFLAGDRHAERSLRELREHLAVEACDCFQFIVASLDVMLAVRRGDLAAARSAAEEGRQLGLAVGDADAVGFYCAQLAGIHWFEGRSDELLPAIKDLAHSTTLATPNEMVFAGLAVLAADAGDLDTARSTFEALRRDGLAAIPRSSNWLATLMCVCEVAHSLGDVAAANEAYELLSPYESLPVTTSLAVFCFGSAHRPLGVAAHTIGDLDKAIGHLEAAIVADLALHHRPAHAMDCAVLADLLEERADPGDGRRALDLRARAISDADRFGMTGSAARWRARAACRDVAVVTLTRDGSRCHVAVDERQIEFAHSTGMSYLAMLVERPGEEIPCIELATGSALTLRGAPTEPVLDPAAVAAYRRHIAALQEDIDDADACADLERAATARLELDRCLDELAKATGFAGRPRHFHDDAERARVAVHKAIKRALAQLEAVDPGVADELRARIVTGMRCVFRPRRAG
jgi:hypothetical protein